MRVCLLAEGSYPYVVGGVSKWCQDLIESLPSVDFTVISLWPEPGTSGEPRYPRPRNVREVRNLYLHAGRSRRDRPPRGFEENAQAFEEALLTGQAAPLEGIAGGAGALLDGDGAWDRACALYAKHAPPELPFTEYWWTRESILSPLVPVLEAVAPDVDVIHSISTGYAGLLAASMSRSSGIPMLVTEHGLYTRERIQELWDADWIPGEAFARERRRPNFFKEWWKNAFLSFEKTAYAAADPVIALFDANRQYQIAHGADEAHARVVPNGVDVAAYEAVRKRRRPSGGFHVGLVGRVVPIKDIRTFISAMKILERKLEPGVLKAWILGPEDEDPDYAAGCRDLVRLLGLEETVAFTGRVDCRIHYETLDAVVLTSLSEGQPLSVLEAMACGIPVVASDVGACRELLEGLERSDRALGVAGMLTPPADAEGVAAALANLAGDPVLRGSMGEAGRVRARTYYRTELVGERYLEIYRSAAARRHRRIPAAARA